MSGSPSSAAAAILADGGILIQPARQRSAADLSLSTDAPSSLVQACYASLTAAPLNHAKLEQLPQHVLVQLLTRAVADRDQAKATVQQQEQELAKIAEEKEQQYVINPPVVLDRVGDMYNLVEAVTAKWAPRLKYSDFTAHDSVLNYRNRTMLYDITDKTILLDAAYSRRAGPNRYLWDVMSSALLLYRICCLFQGLHIEVNGPEGYKVVWSAEVQHVATGEAVGFSEYKAGASIRVSNLRGPKQFEDDMLELLNLIYNERCPHPYDGTVAGTVA